MGAAVVKKIAGIKVVEEDRRDRCDRENDGVHVEGAKIMRREL
jgi:hypothetical protein